ncbi:hypothetical protein IMSAG192_00817 [Muribaculaceae bacterium]|nr:hypothetical protein IMSAG192_00817 [Muribaculaceae bacterium]
MADIWAIEIFRIIRPRSTRYFKYVFTSGTVGIREIDIRSYMPEFTDSIPAGK